MSIPLFLERCFANRFLNRIAHKAGVRARHAAVPACGRPPSALRRAPAPAAAASFHEWPSEWDGAPLRPLALGEVEQRFAAALSRRHRAHDRRPADAGAAPGERAHAHAASGRRLLPRARLSHRADPAGTRSRRPDCGVVSSPTAPARQKLRVCERIVDAEGDGFHRHFSLVLGGGQRPVARAVAGCHPGKAVDRVNERFVEKSAALPAFRRCWPWC